MRYKGDIMKGQRILLAAGLAAGLALLVLAALTGHPSQAAPACDRYVVVGGDDSAGNDCSNPATPCKTIQHALERADPDDVICVADRSDLAGPTTYYAPISLFTSSVTLDGAWQAACGGTCAFVSAPCAPQNVVIDGKGAARVIEIVGGSPTIYCFTITGGNAGGAASNPNRGGGIAAWDAAPIILDNIITANYGCRACSSGQGRGGGIYLVNAPAAAMISGNLIANNTAASNTTGWGGGVYLENASPQVLSNTIQHNRAGHLAGNGGGIAVVGGSPLIADNHVLTNTAGENNFGYGGGVFVMSSSPVTIERNRIEGNVALRGTATGGLYSRGGGLFFDGPLAVIRDNHVAGNVATRSAGGQGGGMGLHGLSASAAVEGNVVTGNRASYTADGDGGGMYLLECNAVVADNHVFGNIASSSPPAYGGGIYVDGGGGLIRNNAITGNSTVVYSAGQWAYGGGMAIVESSACAQDNLIAQNEAVVGDEASGVGGGVYVWRGAPRFMGNQVLSNTAGSGNVAEGHGGGFALLSSAPWLEGNIITGNRAPGAVGGLGGGVHIASCAAFTLTNNIIAHNGISATVGAPAAGSGVEISYSRGQMAHNTIVANSSGGGNGVHIIGMSDVLLYNHIIISQTVGIVNATPLSSTVTADHTLFEGNGANYGSGVTSVNEVAGPANLTGNYHLRSGSGAIDRALPLAWATQDVDGDPRPLGAGPDVGADETRFVYLPLVLR